MTIVRQIETMTKTKTALFIFNLPKKYVHDVPGERINQGFYVARVALERNVGNSQ